MVDCESAGRVINIVRVHINIAKRQNFIAFINCLQLSQINIRCTPTATTTREYPAFIQICEEVTPYKEMRIREGKTAPRKISQCKRISTQNDENMEQSCAFNSKFVYFVHAENMERRIIALLGDAPLVSVNGARGVKSIAWRYKSFSVEEIKIWLTFRSEKDLPLSLFRILRYE
jgi:hypothetical protein